MLGGIEIGREWQKGRASSSGTSRITGTEVCLSQSNCKSELINNDFMYLKGRDGASVLEQMRINLLTLGHFIPKYRFSLLFFVLGKWPSNAALHACLQEQDGKNKHILINT